LSVIVAERLTKRYGQRVGIDGLDLTVGEGTVFGFLGPNGSGKTTTIRLLIGLLRATAGVGRVFGLDCWNASHRIKHDIGYVPGDLRLYRWLNCDRALRILSMVRGRNLTTPGRRLAEAFELDPTVAVRHMSRGMRQKLGLVLALVHEPRLLILDEPSTGLDPLMQDRLYTQLRALAAKGHTVFFSTHTLSEVELLCDRLAILREGRVVEADSVQNLRSRAARAVSIRWATSVEPQSIRPPSFLYVLQRNGREWRATLAGPTLPLVQWCAAQPIEDLAIESPDLTGLFRSYYRDRGAAG
jgi:ABC-2 type transport system ATP-binding protein